MIPFIEIPVLNIDLAKDFYAKVFGWKTAGKSESGYVCIYSTEVKAGAEIGAFKRVEEFTKSGGIVPFFSVLNIDTALTQASCLGSAILEGKIKISDHWGNRAIFSDPFGNQIGLHESAN